MAQTAFDEALANGGSMPGYLTAADTFSNANRNTTFLHSALDTVRSIERFIGLSMISGANEIYNMPANIGNMMGANYQTSKTEDVIANLDDDYQQFYGDHKVGVDLVGFMASSIIPGTGGIKMMNAGQRALKAAAVNGKMGKNLAHAFGLLPKQFRKGKMASALDEIAVGNAPAKFSGQAIQSVAAGFGQNALEALAFETAVVATMHSSPVLEDQDFGDFVTNVAVGGVLFGAFGAGIDAVKANSAIKNSAKLFNDRSMPFKFQEATAQKSSIYETIATDLEQIKSMPKVEDLYPSGTDLANNLAATRTSTLNKLNGRVRENVGKLANDDQDIAGAFHSFLANTPVVNQQSKYIGLQNLSRVGQKSKEVVQLERMEKKLATELLDLTNPDPEMLAFINNGEYVSYTKMWGDDMGNSYKEEYGRSLMDGLGKDGKITITESGVQVGDVDSFRFLQSDVIGRSASADTASRWDLMGKAEEARSVEARYAWARSDKFASFPDMLAADPKRKIVIHGNDLPMLEKLLKEMPEAGSDPRVSIILPESAIVNPTAAGLHKFLASQKRITANLLGERNIELINNFKPTLTMDQREIAKFVNVRDRFLSGEHKIAADRGTALDDMFALDSYADELAEQLGVENIGGKIQVGPSKDGGKNIWEIPQTIRAIYKGEPGTDLLHKGQRGVDLTKNKEIKNFVTENMVIIKENQRVYQDGLKIASAHALGEEVYNALPRITTGDIRIGANPNGAGPKGLTAASNNYGSLAATTEYIGSITSRASEANKTMLRENLEPTLQKMGISQEAAIEFSVINAQLRNYPGEYVLNEAGDALVPAVIKRHDEMMLAAQKTGSEAPEMWQLPDAGMPLEIPIKSQATREVWAAHIAENGRRTGGLISIRAAQGVDLKRSVDAAYPIPPNPSDYNYFAVVVDRGATGGGASRTLYATSADELGIMKRKIEQNPQMQVFTKKEAERYYKEHGQWDYEETVNSMYLNNELKRSGVSSAEIVPTDPGKIVEDILNWHLQRETGAVREGIKAKYEVQFEELRRLGDEATNLETSRFGGKFLDKLVGETVKNPFESYIKTALSIRDHEAYPIWTAINKYSDEVVSSAMKSAHDAFYTLRKDADVSKINGFLAQAGYKGAAYDEQMNVFANTSPARGALSAVVQKANSVLATVVLRWDFLNAINNAVSANVLLGAETKAVQRAIARGDSEAAGALSKLTNIAVPGAQQTMMAPTKLIANALKAQLDEGLDGPTGAMFRANGYMTSITDQYRDTIRSLAFTGKESVGQMESQVSGAADLMRRAADKGEIFTGNKLAEETNRFVAAHVMKQMTDVAVKRNLMTIQEQAAYINTFVNRTQGNYLAAQRPMAFQGPVGQAIGLFQTYQFNLIQQLTRHIGEGQAKDAMTMMMLQGTIHGMNGLPAFNAVNTHIVGNASGNQSHADAFDVMYGTVGKEAGDFLMYGAASTAMGLLSPELKVNLYTRGDLNPRNVTILPTDPAKVPFIQAWTKFAKNLVETGKVLAAGADPGSAILRGLEHNGVSRPLAGLAATLNGFNNPNHASYSTSKRGNIIGANDLFSLANITRIAGGKPLDEAVAIDATYRFQVYGLEDSRRRQVLGKAIKTTMMAGNTPSQSQIETFAENYAAVGGRQEEFAGWFAGLYTEANSSQANEIARSLNSPFSQSMQTLMGGVPLEDFSGKGGF